jgi:hypothetical protein
MGEGWGEGELPFTLILSHRGRGDPFSSFLALDASMKDSEGA